MLKGANNTYIKVYFLPLWDFRSSQPLEKEKVRHINIKGKHSKERYAIRKNYSEENVTEIKVV